MASFLDRLVFLSRIPLRRWYRDPARLIAVGLSLALASALIMAMLEAGDAAVGSFSRRSRALGGENAIVVRPRQGVIGINEVGRIGPLLGDGSRVIPVVEVSAKIKCGENLRPILLIGLDALRLSAIAGESVRSGIGLAQSLASSCGIKVGGIVEAAVDDRNVELHVDTLLTASNSVTLGAGGVVAIAEAQRLLGRGDGISSLIVIPYSADGVGKIKRRLAAIFPQASVASSLDQRARASELTEAFRTNIGILILVSLLLALLLVLHTSELSFLRVRDFINLLRIVGLNPLAAAAIFIAEMCIVGASGIAAGIILGLPLTRGVANLLLTTIEAFYIPNAAAFLPTLGAKRALVAGAVLLVVALSAAYPSLKRLGGPLSVGGDTQGDTSAASKRSLVWPLLAVITFAFSLLISYLSLNPLAAYLTAFLLFTTLVMLSPALVVRGAYLLREVILRVGGAPGLIALSQLNSRIANSHLSLAVLSVGLALMIGTQVFVSSFRVSLGNWALATFKADIYIRPEADGDWQNPALLSHDVIDSVSRHPGVDVVLPVYLAADVVRDRGITVRGENLSTSQRLRSLVGVTNDEYQKCSEQNGAIVSESAARRLGVGRGSAIGLRGQSLLVCAVFREYTREEGIVVVDQALFKSLYSPFPSPTDVAAAGQTKQQEARNTSLNTIEPQSLSLLLKPGVSPDVVEEELQSILAQHSLKIVVTAKLRKIVSDVFDETFRITLVMTIIVALVAAISIVFSAVQHAIERIKENRLYVSLGVRNSELILAGVIEGLLLAGPSLLLGGGGGFLLGFVLVEIINPATFGWSLDLVLRGIDFVSPISVILLATIVSACLSSPVVAWHTSGELRED